MYMDSFFMVASTSYAVPSAPSMVFLRRSEPARSTKLSLDVTTFSLTPDRLCCRSVTVKMECDRFELRFSLCCAVVRASWPEYSRLSASASDATSTSVRPRTNTPRPPFSSTIW